MNISILELERDYDGLLYIGVVYSLIKENPDIHLNLLTYLVRAAINESALDETRNMITKAESIIDDNDDDEFHLDNAEELVDEAQFRLDDEECTLTSNQRLLFNYDISSEIRILLQYRLIERGAYKNCYRVRKQEEYRESA